MSDQPKCAMLVKVFSDWLASRYKKAALPTPFTYQIEVTESDAEYVDTNLSPPMLIFILEGDQKCLPTHWLPFNFVADMGANYHDSNGNRYRYQFMQP